jgi:hypothetical protein
MTQSIDFDGIKAAALRNGCSFVQDLIPGGKFRSLEYIVRNPKRDDRHPGSFTINYKTGVWKDFATGDGGSDLISLVVFVQGVARAMPPVSWQIDSVSLFLSRTAPRHQSRLTEASQQKRREFMTGATAGHHSGMKFVVMFISATASRFV